MDKQFRAKINKLELALKNNLKKRKSSQKKFKKKKINASTL